MKYSAEIPTKYLEEFSKYLDYGFCIAPFVLLNEEYADFYKKLLSSGTEVILDNGTFEFGKPILDKSYEIAVDILKPTYVIAPDYLHDFRETLLKTSQFVTEFRKSFSTKVMGVPQGASAVELIKCYLDLLPIVDAIAFPFQLDYYADFKNLPIGKRWAQNRIRLIDYMINSNLIDYSKRHHLLGSGCPSELKSYKENKYKFIQSTDTSSPIVHGLYGVRFTEEGLPYDKIMEKLNYDITIPENRKSDIIFNLEWMKVVCQ